MLTDAQWAEVAPLVERCRPHAKGPPSNLRRTVSAILWRHTNGGRQLLALPDLLAFRSLARPADAPGWTSPRLETISKGEFHD